MTNATPLIAYHNDAAIKEKYLSRVREHRKEDQLVKGTYWQNGKGCAVGCTIHSGQHSRFERSPPSKRAGILLKHVER